MSDMTLCKNYKCPKKTSCLRYRAVAKPAWQSYAGFQYDSKTGCEYYLDVLDFKYENIVPMVDADNRAK